MAMKVFIIAAITVDGFIGKSSGHFPSWTSPEDTKHFVNKTKEAGVVVMGSTTYQTILDHGKRLPGRRVIVYTSSPDKFPGVETTQDSPAQLLDRLHAEGVELVAICGGSQIYSLFLNSKVVDELYITVEPLIFGSGVPLFADETDAKLKLLESTPLNSSTLLLHYAVLK